MKTGKTLFIIPGFKEKIAQKQYRALQKLFAAKGFMVRLVPIVWERTVMSDWIAQFHDAYRAHRGEKNVVLGFSFGAMIALIAAKELKPDELILCSLSPYFSEDLPTIPDRWKRFIGKRRTEDFGRYAMKSAVKDVSGETTVFIGSVEQKKFPQLAKRCASAARALGTSVIVVEGAEHDIGDVRYRKALDQEISEV